MSALSAPAETIIGKYRLIASLGHGGMADVYLAVASGPAGFNKLQVVKRLRRGAADERDQVEMFLDEARLAARLNHPNVVQTFEVGTTGGEYFMAMEYLEGVPFNRVLSHCRKHGAPPGVLIHILTDALAGLHYAHELTDYDGTPLHIVHRDASPHNIIVTFDGQTKLLDFGIAKSGVRMNMTRAGIIKGKIGYMAPEQALSRPLDRRADIFVLGIILWEIVAGRRMWENADEMAALRLLGLGMIPDVREAKPDAPAELVRICGRAVATEPDSRYATAAEMRSELLEYMHGAGLRVTAEDVGRFVSAELGEKRAGIRKTIEHQLGKLKSESAPLPELGAVIESSSLPVLDSAPNSINTTSDSRNTNVTPPPSTDPSRSLPAAAAPLAETLRPPAVIEVHPPASSTTARSAAEAAGAAMGGEPAAPAQPAPPPPSSAARVAAVVAVAAIAAAIAWFALGPGKRADPPAAAGAGAQPVSSLAEAPAGAPASAAASPVAGMIELRIRVEPQSAEIYVDDARLPSNPFTGKFPADGATHRLRMEAPDRKTESRVVVFDRDQSIDLSLDTRTAGAGARAWVAPAQAAAEPTTATPTPAETPPVAPTAGLGNPPKGKPKRSLGDDPFAAPTTTSTKPKRALGDGI